MLLPMLVGLIGSWVIESQMRPVPQPFWKRPWSAQALHAGTWIILFVMELILFRRPWLAVANGLALFYVLVLVNNAKYESLREPFIFQDFDYGVDAIKHPRLYLPFLGVRKAALGAGGVGLALILGIKAEPTLGQSSLAGEWIAYVLAITVAGFGLLWLGCGRRRQPSFHIEGDLKNVGLLANLWHYAIAERNSPPVRPVFSGSVRVQPLSEILPNLVVVQSESFFDVRRYYPGVRVDVLSQYDEIKRTAACHGLLDVPAWGANTVRSEFGFLSGLPAKALGIHQFNPYRKLARREFSTLASFLKGLGYRTVCVHPYPSSFYDRDKVFPQMGFDEFIDIRDFADWGDGEPYVGDIALAEKVRAILRRDDANPIFLFVITMENHGPLHLEQVGASDVEKLFSVVPPSGCKDLMAYTRHLANADRMIGILREQLEAMPQQGWLCWYGDHVPIMPAVLRTLGLPDGRTDYLIWAARSSPGESVLMDTSIESLSGILIKHMGLARFLTVDERLPPAQI